MENKEENFEVQVLTRLAVIESKLDEQKETKDTAYRAYNNAKENTKDINNLKEKYNELKNKYEKLDSKIENETVGKDAKAWRDSKSKLISWGITAVLAIIAGALGISKFL